MQHAHLCQSLLPGKGSVTGLGYRLPRVGRPPDTARTELLRPLVRRFAFRHFWQRLKRLPSDGGNSALQTVHADHCRAFRHLAQERSLA